MKISLTYLPDDAKEEQQVKVIRAFLKSYLPGAKMRVSYRYDPYVHIYFATKKPGNPLDH